MGIGAAIHQSEADPISWNGIEGGASHNRERFPWEHGSARDLWSRRIGTLLFGACLAWLVFVFNTKPITALMNEAQQFTGSNNLMSAHASASSAQPLRHEPAATRPPALLPLVSQRAGLPPSRVQLGSYSSEPEARAASEMMRQSYGASIEGRNLTISKAVVRQVQYYRVVIDLQSDRDARDLCGTIRKEKKDCLVWTAAAIEDVN